MMEPGNVNLSRRIQKSRRVGPVQRWVRRGFYFLTVAVFVLLMALANGSVGR